MKRGIWSVFCQHHSSRTSYQARNDWLQYRINLVTRIPVNFQYKTNLALNDYLDPQIILRFSACNRYAKRCLIICVLPANGLPLIFCVVNRFDHGNPIVGNKYKNGETYRFMIVIITIYSPYLSKWCTTIPNDYPIPL